MSFFIITDNSPQTEGGEVVSNMEKAVTVSAPNTGFQCVHCGKLGENMSNMSTTKL